jgi:hypothetical protein
MFGNSAAARRNSDLTVPSSAKGVLMRPHYRNAIWVLFILLAFSLPISVSQAAPVNFQAGFTDPLTGVTYAQVALSGSFTYDPSTNSITTWSFTETCCANTPPPGLLANYPPETFTYDPTNSVPSITTLGSLAAGSVGSVVSFYINPPAGPLPATYELGPAIGPGYPIAPEVVLNLAINVTLSPTLTLSALAPGVPLLTKDAGDCLHGLDVSTGNVFTFCSDEYIPPGPVLIGPPYDDIRYIVQPAFLLPSDPPLGPITFTLTSVPEPSTLLLVGSGLAGLGSLAWKRRRVRWGQRRFRVQAPRMWVSVR